MMQVHIPTMFLMVIAVSATLAALVAATAYRRGSDGLIVWAGALAVNTLAYVLLSLRGMVSDIATIVVANALLATAYALFAEGLFLFQRRSPPRWLIWLPVIFVTVVFAFLLDQLRLRVIVSGMISAAQCLLVLIALIEKRQETVGRGQYFLIIAFVIAIAIFAYRAIGTAIGMEEMLSLTASNSIQALTFLTAIICTPLMALGLLVMTKERSEEALQESKAFLQAIVDSVTGHVAVLDNAGIITAVNEPWRRFAQENSNEEGQPAANTDVGTNYLEACQSDRLLPSADAKNAWNGIQAVLAGSIPAFSMEYPCHTPAAPRWFLMTATRLLSRQKGAVIVHNDITARKLSENAREETLGYLQKVSSSVPGVIYEFRMRPDGTMHFPYISPRVEIFGLTPETLAQDSAPFSAITHPDDSRMVWENIRESAANLSQWRAQFRILLPTGEYRWYEGQATPEKYTDGSIVWFGYIADIQAQKDTEERIGQMALHDALTGLPNRTLFDDRLHYDLAAASRDQTMLGLMFIDLDQFKPVNDSFGHRIGDLLLTEGAKRIRNAVRESDTPARIGGDEFVVLLRNIQHYQDVWMVAEKIRVELSAPFVVEEHLLNISASIGIALYPEHGADAVELARHADEAMYRAKEGGRNRIEFFAPPALPSARTRSFITLTWKSAFACGEPVIDSEHRELFRLANILLEQTVDSNTRREDFNVAFDALLSHVVEHFAHEESILRQHGYTDVGQHAEVHQRLLEQARNLRRQADGSGVSIGELVNFLATEVVANHMLHEDRAYYATFAGKMADLPAPAPRQD